MPTSKNYIFVLWGHGFDESVATIFVTELREAGLLVRVVGLTPRQISGAHGLALVPDLTLDQAVSLASQTICLIIPSNSRWPERYDHDPRVHQFFKLANANQAKFITGQYPGQSGQAAPENEVPHTNLVLSILDTENANVMIYPEIEMVIPFARETAKLLLENISAG